jgi:GxxExxY protein
MDGDVETTDRILRCAVQVHRVLGPGLFETAYERAMCVELAANGIPFRQQVAVPLYYRGEIISEHRLDLIVDEKVIVEIKSVDRFAPVHMTQLLTYLRVTSLQVGLLLNFNSPTLKAGTRRVVLNAPRFRDSAVSSDVRDENG